MQLTRSADTRWEGVTHDPEIRKRVFVRDGRVPKLTNFSESVLAPGQVCTEHTHPDMFEVYRVMAGTATLVVDGAEHELETGDCAVVEPGEAHSLGNRSAEELHLVYFGLEV